MAPERRALVLSGISGIGAAGISVVAAALLAAHVLDMKMGLSGALSVAALLLPGSAGLGALLSYLAGRPAAAPLIPTGVMAVLGFLLGAFHIVLLGVGGFVLHWSIVFLRSSKYTPAEWWGGFAIFIVTIAVGALYAPVFSLFAILMAVLQRRWPNNALQRTRFARR